jgi:lactate permease
MTFLLAILPIALLIVLMTSPWPRRMGGWGLPLSAPVALPLMALLGYALQLVYFGAGGAGRAAGVSLAEALENRVVHAAAIDGVLSALTPLAIVLGAVLLFKTMEKSGAMGVLTARLRALSPDPVAQLMLVGWAFSFLIEGLSGFGTPAALAAPILVGLGFPALRAAAMCLVMNSVPVSFGAVGTPTWFGLGEVGLSPAELGEIGWRTALIHAAAAPVIVLLALRIAVPWREVRTRWLFILLVLAASVGPYLLTARFSVEFPSIAGGLTGLIAAGVLARLRIGLPSAPVTSAAESAHLADVARPMSLARAATPLLAVVALLGVTRIDAPPVFILRDLLTSSAGAASMMLGPLGEAWASPSLVVGLRNILGTDAAWSMPLLYVPFILPFVVVALAAIPLLKMSRAAVAAAWGETARRLARPAIALVGALLLVKMMMAGGDQAPAMILGRGMAGASAAIGGEGAWPFFAPLLGALGAFFSGSNTVSNLTFAPIQAAIAQTAGLDVLTVLALQSAGGALGNMVAIHNIVAVAAVVGLAESGKAGKQDVAAGGGTASVLRLTSGPMLAYAAIAASAAGVLLAVY